jgi:hypothetical protein
MIKVNFLISANHLLAVEELNNGLNGNISTAEFTKINLSTPHSHIYLIIEVRFKTEEYWYIAKTLLNSDTERNFILQILITQFHLTLTGRDTERIKVLDSRQIQIYDLYQIEIQVRDSLKIQRMIIQE